METLYKWRVQEKDPRGRVRWRLVKAPMTEDTARFWAANNNKVIERIDALSPAQQRPQPGTAINPGVSMKLR
ncbi:MAG: hypothetical protein K2X06_11460 [Burkholderiales bacterium]|nr:hypothetical protein [Burkholderiales bacterium]